MEKSSDGRFFVHGFPETEGPDLHLLRPTLLHAIPRIRESIVDHAIRGGPKRHEHGIYTSNLGIAFALFLRSDPAWKDIMRATSYEGSDRGCTLLDSAILGPVLEGDRNALLEYVERAHRLPSTECELLYGRAGCLSAILLAREIHPEVILDQQVRCLVEQIIRGGANPGAEMLMWRWHEKEYLGAVHGLAGILFVLLKCPPDILDTVDPHLKPRIEACVQNVLSNYILPSGNIQSSTGNRSDHLVHFCHGATGWIPLLCLMKERFAQARYGAHACELGEVVWRRGLLASKGPGICHGISGSICALVDLYRLTRDIKWMQRAEWFVLFLAREWQQLAPKADRPYSLFEGITGAFYVMSLVLSERDRSEGIFTTSFPGL